MREAHQVYVYGIKVSTNMCQTSAAQWHNIACLDLREVS